MTDMTNPTPQPNAADGRRAKRMASGIPSSYVTFRCPLPLKDKIVADAAKYGLSMSAHLNVTLNRFYSEDNQ